MADRTSFLLALPEAPLVEEQTNEGEVPPADIVVIPIMEQIVSNIQSLRSGGGIKKLKTS